MSTQFDHLDAIDQASHKIEALSLAVGCMATASINSDLIATVADIAADLAVAVRCEVGALLEGHRNVDH